jgi:hypothetical protein
MKDVVLRLQQPLRKRLFSRITIEAVIQPNFVVARVIAEIPVTKYMTQSATLAFDPKNSFGF